MDQVHAHVARQQVVIGVTRLNHRFIHVHHAVPTLFVVAKTVVAKLEKAWVRNLMRGCSFPRLQGCQRHERLVCRAGRVGATQGPVEQGFVQRFVERLPIFRVNALDKQVGVKGGLADKGQNLTGFGVDGHQGATAVAVQVLGQLLQLDVDGQHDGVAGLGRAAAQAPNGPTACRRLHFVHTGDAMQLSLIALLHTQLANVVGAPVVGSIFRVLQLGLFAGVDATDVPNHMAGQLTIGVVAEQTGLDFHASKAVALGGKPRHLFIGETGANRHRVKTL